MNHVICLVLLAMPLFGVAEAQERFELYPDSGLYNSFDDHLEAERHYLACKTSVEQLTAYSASQALLVQDLSGRLNSCHANSNSVEIKFGGGLLYKPNGNTGTPVLVMHKRYTEGQVDGGANLIGQVDVFDKDDNLIERLRYTGAGNGGRGNHRFNKTVSQLLPLAPLTARWIFNGIEEHIIIPDPSRRYE